MATLTHQEYDSSYPVKLAFDLTFAGVESKEGAQRYSAECCIRLGEDGQSRYQRLSATLVDVTDDDILALIRDIEGLLSGTKEVFSWSPAEPEIVVEMVVANRGQEDGEEGEAEMILTPKVRSETSFHAQILVDCWAFGVGGSFSGDGVGLEMDIGTEQLRRFYDEMKAEVSALGL